MIELQGIGKTYQKATLKFEVLHDLCLSIGAGEFVAIMGQSGSGKTTLLNIIGCLDTASVGRYCLAGEEVTALNQDQHVARLRNQRLGFVFQSFNLLPRATALENVMLPMVYAHSKTPVKQWRAQAEALLCQYGLAQHLAHKPTQLSGGQQQRVAICRALMQDPQVLIADEPTGSLDTQTGHEVMDSFSELNRQGKTIVMVTHELDIAAYAKRQVRLVDGRITHDSAQP